MTSILDPYPDVSLRESWLAAEGPTAEQEADMAEAIAEHEALESLFAWATEHDHERAQWTYNAAVELEAGPIRSYELERHITPIDELDEADLDFQSALAHEEAAQALIAKWEEEHA